MSLSLAFKQHPIKAILFDLDGTLLDTASDLGAAVNVLLQRDNLPLLDKTTIHQTASQGANALIKAGYGPDLSTIELAKLRIEFLAYYENNLANHTKYLAGASLLLETLNQHRIPWGIITNKPYMYTKALLQQFPLLATSHVTLSGDSMAVRKPNPLPLIVAAKSLLINPTEIAYVGDALTDIQAANSAEMISVAANYGYIPDGDNVSHWHADMIIDHCNDILTVLSH